MSSESSGGPVLPGVEGNAEKLPCPQCGRSLRGVGEPRCAECGFDFEDWEDLPLYCEEAARWQRRRKIIMRVFVALLLLVGFGLIVSLQRPHRGGMSHEECFIYTLLLVSLMQTVVEVGAASVIVGLPRWRTWLAWWEGVLIGYGVCGFILYLNGYALSFFENAFFHWDWLTTGTVRLGGVNPFEFFWGDAKGLWPLWAMSGVASLLVQWAVVWYRTRRWPQAIPALRLLPACLLAKAIVCAVWMAGPVRMMSV